MTISAVSAAPSFSVPVVESSVKEGSLDGRPVRCCLVGCACKTIWAIYLVAVGFLLHSGHTLLASFAIGLGIGVGSLIHCVIAPICRRL